MVRTRRSAGNSDRSGGPLLGAILRDLDAGSLPAQPGRTRPTAPSWGLDPASFRQASGREGPSTPPASCVRAPSVISFPTPGRACRRGRVGDDGPARSMRRRRSEGSVQLEAVIGPAPRDSGLVPSGSTVTIAPGPWTSNNLRTSTTSPIVVNPEEARAGGASKRPWTTSAIFSRRLSATPRSCRSMRSSPSRCSIGRMGTWRG